MTGGRRVELVEEVVPLRGRQLRILRPRDSEELLDEDAFEHEEFLPYWAELWPSGVALARMLSVRSLCGARTVELGCGLALPSIAAALSGARVVATDWSSDALELAELNAARNGVSLELIRCSWAEPEAIVERAPWDLVLAADVLYERRNVEQLLAVLPRLGGEVLIAEPGRPHARSFFEQASESRRIEKIEREAVPIYRLVAEVAGSRARGASARLRSPQAATMKTGVPTSTRAKSQSACARETRTQPCVIE
jgi:predicted nicotinamide N-methyase